MFMTPVGPAAAATLPAAAVADHLETLTAGLESRFRHVGETLASAIDMIERMGTGLDEIQRSLSPEVAGAAITRLRQAANRLNTLPAIQQRRAAEIHTLTTRTREMRALLADVGEILHLLNFYGLSIKIASSGETAFFNFVTGMEGKLESGRKELRHFGGELDRFGAVIADLRNADRLLAEECQKIGPEAPAELTSGADALQSQLETVAHMAQDVGAVMRTVQAEVARMLGAIQIGDSVRQRTEHGIAILRRIAGEDLPPAAAAHMTRLVAAQLRATAGDFSREIAALIVATDRLGPLAARLLALVEAQGGDGREGDVLFRVERGIADVSQVTGRLREADQQLASLAGFVSRTFAGLLEGLSRIQRIALDVQDISTNTRLLCRRHGVTGRAVAVIATEVAPCATRLDRSSADVARLIADLAEVELARGGHAATAAGSDADLALDAALAVVRSACESSDRAVSDSGGEARAIVGSLRSSAGDLMAQQAFAGALEEGAATLDDHAAAVGLGADAEADADAEAALGALLPWAASLYTMACEREIHAGFLLPGMTAPASAPSGDDEDDDGLF